MTIAVVLYALGAGLAIIQGLLVSRANPDDRIPLWRAAPNQTHLTRWLLFPAIFSATFAAGIAGPRMNFGVGVIIAMACLNIPLILTEMLHNQRLRHRPHGLRAPAK